MTAVNKLPLRAVGRQVISIKGEAIDVCLDDRGEPALIAHMSTDAPTRGCDIEMLVERKSYAPAQRRYLGRIDYHGTELFVFERLNKEEGQ